VRQRITRLSIAERKVWRAGMRHIQKHDPVLGSIVKRIGPVDFEVDDGHYEALVGAIIYQQLAGAAARAILDRFKKIYGGKIPDPKQYLSTDEKTLRASGLSPQKISYIGDLCERIVRGSLDLPSLTHLPDEEAVERLDEIRGVGRWTAEMFLLFVLGRKDVLPVDDLGVQKAVKRIYHLRKLPSKKKFEQLAKNWHPYCSIATLYLWRSGETNEKPAKW
jgi:DNA-3-methyladenine glycosylase II